MDAGLGNTHEQAGEQLFNKKRQRPLERTVSASIEIIEFEKVV